MLRFERLSSSNGGLNGISPPNMFMKRAGGVAVVALDLHDVRAPVGEEAAGRRARDPDAELDHLDAGERPRAERRDLLAGLVVGLVAPGQPVENPARSLRGQAAPFLRRKSREKSPNRV